MNPPATGIRIIPPLLFRAACLIAWFINLLAAFGEAYRRYKARLRRWL